MGSPCIKVQEALTNSSVKRISWNTVNRGDGESRGSGPIVTFLGAVAGSFDTGVLVQSQQRVTLWGRLEQFADDFAFGEQWDGSAGVIEDRLVGIDPEVAIHRGKQIVWP